MPVLHRVCRIPTEAEEDWMIAVNTAPNGMPTMGLVKEIIRSANQASVFRNAMELLMRSIPVIRAMKPRQMVPIPFFFSLLAPKAKKPSTRQKKKNK